MLTPLGITTEPDEHIDDKPDHSWSDEPICPYCFVMETDAWEMNFGKGLDGDTEHTCASCGKEYFVSRLCIVRYETRPICEYVMEMSELEEKIRETAEALDKLMKLRELAYPDSRRADT